MTKKKESIFVKLSVLIDVTGWYRMISSRLHDFVPESVTG